MARHGAAMHLPQAELTAADAGRRCSPGWTAPHCWRMAEKARGLARPHAAARVGRRDRKAGGTHETRRQAHPLRRRRRRRHERHRRDPAQPGLHGLGLGPARQRHRAPAGAAGHPGATSATTPRTSAVPRPWSPPPPCRRDNPEVHRRSRQTRAGGAARGDAGRTDAPEAGHRHRRHAWQDDHHLAGRQRAGRSRPGPDLRRSAGCCTAPAPMRGWARATTSWSRPTRATPRS